MWNSEDGYLSRLMATGIKRIRLEICLSLELYAPLVTTEVVEYAVFNGRRAAQDRSVGNHAEL